MQKNEVYKKNGYRGRSCTDL